MPFLPLPVSATRLGGPAFRITAETVIIAPAGSAEGETGARFLSELIGRSAGPVPPPVVRPGQSPRPGAIELILERVDGVGDEGYVLDAAPERVTLRANTPAGLFHGCQALRQALPPWIEYRSLPPDGSREVSLPALRVRDYPRFAWRGAMLDVARHYFPVADIKRFVDLMALHRLNRLHLHLSDDQGWRIEIRSRPELTAVGAATATGGGPGGFYTQAEYAEIASYAAERFITVVPEIDLPGHVNAAQASIPSLNCDETPRPPYHGMEAGFSALCLGRPAVDAFVEDVVREVAAITPGPWFHVGGDEARSLSPDKYRQFMGQLQATVQKHGKRMIGWDEIAPAALDATTIVQHWRPEASPSQAVARGSRVIVSIANRTYLDMKYDATTPIGRSWAGIIDVRRAFEWDPATAVAGVPASAILGVEAPLWTETTATFRDVEFMAFPRLAAIAELAWSPAGGRDWGGFRERLGAQAPRWTALGVNFFRDPGVPWQPTPGCQAVAAGR